ncbi:hypothetical protein HD593_006064 [Nonomuraea rubra]|uniref:Uncharacterized protein n=1 Tax=Nonomuraea rubra TaxID=46180 RepID=A0A7X0NXK7_9ACTN|nr:hypothetical protein [Nonomuraea rubra]
MAQALTIEELLLLPATVDLPNGGQGVRHRPD